jgi:multisubunit Na+/H+ antiporter MnhB subunit
MKRFGLGVLGFIAGYLIAAVVGYFLIGALSSNMHDRSVEAAMTSAFVLGPIGAISGFIVGFIRGRQAPVSAGPKS